MKGCIVELPNVGARKKQLIPILRRKRHRLILVFSCSTTREGRSIGRNEETFTLRSLSIVAASFPSSYRRTEDSRPESLYRQSMFTYSIFDKLNLIELLQLRMQGNKKCPTLPLALNQFVAIVHDPRSASASVPWLKHEPVLEGLSSLVWGSSNGRLVEQGRLKH